MADFARLVLDADTRGLKTAERDLKSVTRSASETASKVGAKMRSLGTGLTIGVTAPLTLFGKGAVQAAIDAEELQSMFDTTFGAMSDTMNKWARETGDAMGRSTQELQQSAAVFQGFFKDMLPEADAAEFSRKLTVLSQDVASFKNLSNDDAQRRLFAAVTGEYESLKALGVVINDTVMKAKAMEMGFGNSTSKLTEQEKVLIRVALLQQKFADASGDVERTSDSMANQIKKAQANFQELQVTVGEKLIPVLTPLVEKLSSALGWFSQLSPEVRNTILISAGLAAALGPVAIGVGAIIGALTNLAPMLATGGAVRVGMAGMTAALGGPLGIAALAGGVVLAFANWQKIGPWIDGVADRTQKAAGEIDGFLSQLNAKIDETDKALGTGTRAELFESWGKSAKQAWDDINQFDLAAWARGADASIADAFQSFDRFWQGVQAGFNGMSQRAVSSMQAMFEGVRQWVQVKLGETLQWLAGKLGWAGDLFFKLYDRVVGNSYVPDMVDEIGQHMRRLETELVKPAADATQSAADKFRQLQQEVQPILDRLFPAQARDNALVRELELLDEAARKGIISMDGLAQARARALREYGADVDAAPDPIANLLGTPDVSVLTEGIPTAADIITEEWSKVQAANDNVRVSFVDMARDVTASLQGIVNNIRSGDWLSALSGVLDLVGQVMGAINGTGTPATRTYPVRSFSGGGYTGNGARSGGLDGQGGFMAMLHPRETVVDHARGQQAGPVSVTIVADEGAAFVPRVVGISGNVSVSTVKQNNRAQSFRATRRVA